MSTSSADFDKYAPAFDKSVNTLQIAGTIQAPTIAPQFPLVAVGVLFSIAVGAISIILGVTCSNGAYWHGSAQI